MSLHEGGRYLVDDSGPKLNQLQRVRSFRFIFRYFPGRRAVFGFETVDEGVDRIEPTVFSNRFQI